MEPDGICAAVRAAALHTFSDIPVEGRYHRVMVYYLVSCFSDWICKLGTEQHRREQSVQLRQCHTNQDGVRLQRNTKERNSDNRFRLNQRGLSKEQRGHKTSIQDLTICLVTKNSLGLGYSISAGCHYGFDFRLKHCASNGGANLNAVDTPAARTGLNLHLILVILFSTNKLTPEKT